MPAPRWPACRYAAPRRAMPGATSRRMGRAGASLRSAQRADPRRAGSSSGPVFGEKRRQIHRVALQLFEKSKQPVIGHPLRVQDAVEMVAFMLDDAGVEALDGAL